MFGLVLTTFVTSMHLYVFWRTGSVPWIRERFGLKARLGIFLSLWALFLGGRWFGHGGTCLPAAVLEFLGMTWMGAVFLLSTCLLAVDIVTGFGLVYKKAAPRLREAAVIAGLVLSLIALIQGMRPPGIEHYEVSIPGLPPEMDGKVVAGISDLHLGTLTSPRWLELVLSRVSALKPDMIVLLGDIFEGHGPPAEELVSAFHVLKAPLGVWAVPGNHDTHGGDDTFLKLLGKNGVRVLRNEWAEPSPGFVIAGVDDFMVHYRAGFRGSLVRKTLEGVPAGSTVVLLAHRPVGFNEAASDGVSLMLSAHTHGGQIWPFDYVVMRRNPFVEGMYDHMGMKFIVCRGTGTWGPRMRLWARGEIMHITLLRG